MLYNSPKDILVHYLPLHIVNEIFTYSAERYLLYFRTSIAWKNFQQELTAQIMLDENSKLLAEFRYKNGQAHSSQDIPGYVRYYEDGSICRQEWFYQGELHRLNNPAIILYGRKGQIIKKMWFQHNTVTKKDE